MEAMIKQERYEAAEAKARDLFATCNSSGMQVERPLPQRFT